MINAKISEISFNLPTLRTRGSQMTLFSLLSSLQMLSESLLHDDLLDADFAVAEHGGYGCQDTRLVFYQHTQEVFRTDVIHCFDRQLFVAGAADPAAALILEVSGNIKDISDHRTCRWKFSGSAAVEHGIIHGITKTALKESLTDASGCLSGISIGWTRTSIPSGVLRATPRSLITLPVSFA